MNHIKETSDLSRRAVNVMGWTVGESPQFAETAGYFDSNGKFMGHPNDFYPASSMVHAYILLGHIKEDQGLMAVVALKMVAALEVPRNARRCGTTRRVLQGLSPLTLTRCIVEAWEKIYGAEVPTTTGDAPALELAKSETSTCI